MLGLAGLELDVFFFFLEPTPPPDFDAAAGELDFWAVPLPFPGGSFRKKGATSVGRMTHANIRALALKKKRPVMGTTN